MKRISTHFTIITGIKKIIRIINLFEKYVCLKNIRCVESCWFLVVKLTALFIKGSRYLVPLGHNKILIFKS
jgi:hypothetical protein